MPFIVKATYRNETRKISFPDSHFPRFDELYHQLYRVYSIGHSYFLSKLLFSPGGTGRILIGVEAHSAEEYNIHCAPFLGRFYPNGSLTFSVFDETPHKVPQPTLPGSFIHPIPPVPPVPSMPIFTPPPPPPLLSMQPVHMEDIEHDARSTATIGNPFLATQAATKANTVCCSVAEGKQEVKHMMETFIQDLQRVVGSTFPGDERSFFDPLDTPTMKNSTMPHPTSPLPPISLDASLHIPGSFMQPRPQTPEGIYVEKSQSPPQLEPSQMLHPGIWCDFCGKQIRGLRFKCQECPHYDLCANCIVVNQALEKHNADRTSIHRFSNLNPPSQKDITPREIITALGPLVNPPTVIHNDVICDKCNQTIVGARFKCLNCPDFDLCDKCVSSDSAHNVQHRFLKLSTPTQTSFHTTPLPDLTATPSPQVQASPTAKTPTHSLSHNARCNLCDSRITGSRYKCTDCPDFDTCSACFSITTEQHPGHNFVQLTKPADFMIRKPSLQMHHFATCNGCHNHIVGIRYKCMHPDCPDYDLCQDCEALPISIHPDTHSFLKIRNGDARIPVVQWNERQSEVAKVATTTSSEAAAQTADVTTTMQTSEAALVQEVKELSIAESSVSASPPSSPIQRLHAIRDQAARRLNKRMQHLQSYPFAEGSSSGLEIDPVIQERLMRERKEAEEKAQALDQEIEELEKARRRKHDEALKQSSRHFVETLKVVFADEPDTYHTILVLLKECVDAKDQVSLVTSKERLYNLLDGRPGELQVSLEAFLMQEVSPVSVESSPKTEKPATPAITAKEVPEMTQRLTSFFTSLRAVSSLDASFVSDNSIPDGHLFAPGAEFVKSWRIKNTSTETWGEGTELVFVGGDRLGSSGSVPNQYMVMAAQPGEEINLFAKDMKAPETPGRYLSHWRLRDAHGRHFGPRMWCDIEVLEVESDSSHHGSLVNSTVVMPETAPAQALSVYVTPDSSSPVTVPSSVATLTDEASDVSSICSVSVIEHMDSDWDDIPDAPQVQPPPARRQRRTGNADEGYQVLYDSASDDA